MPATKTTIELRGCRIGLMRAGEGAPMLYLHGAAGAGAWLPFMERLSRHFDLIVPEHPGFGVSDTPPWLGSVVLDRFERRHDRRHRDHPAAEGRAEIVRLDTR